MPTSHGSTLLSLSRGPLALLLTICLALGCSSEEKNEAEGVAETSEENREEQSDVAPAPEEESFSYELSFERIGELFADHASMVERFGADQVVKGDISVGEGEILTGTILFGDDPERRLEILWWEPEQMSGPQSVTFSGAPSRWWVAPGLTTGVALDSVVAMNGGPFTLLGLEWDYSGTIVDWKGGRFDALDREETDFIVRLSPSQEAEERVGRKKIESVLGDVDFSSDNPVMAELNPVVYSISLSFAP